MQTASSVEDTPQASSAKPKPLKKANSTSSKISPAAPISSHSKKYALYLHDDEKSKEELILNPQVFPDINKGDVVEISQPRGGNLKPNTILLRVGHTKPAIKGIPFLSIHTSVANLFDFQIRKEVTVKIVQHENVSVDFAELTFKDQFISRSDLHRFCLYLADQTAYISKTYEYAGMRAQVKELMLKQNRVSSGLITKQSKFTFRSRSATIFWLFQMSSEMWEYAEDGDLYFEKAVNGFAREVLSKWESVNVHHSLTIIFFSRYFIKGKVDEKTSPAIGILKDGRKYMDYFKVVIQNDRNISTKSILATLRREFTQYPASVAQLAKTEKLELVNSSYVEGNILEATNLVLNVFDNHHVNRDLARTGQIITLVSPGCGVFNITRQHLSVTTKKRLVDNGIGLDLICLSNPPLHTVPIFRYQKVDPQTKNQFTYYRSAEWINAGFYKGKTFQTDKLDDELNASSIKFVPTCSMKSVSEQPRFDYDDMTVPVLVTPSMRRQHKAVMKSVESEFKFDSFDNISTRSEYRFNLTTDDNMSDTFTGYEDHDENVFNMFQLFHRGNARVPRSVSSDDFKSNLIISPRSVGGGDSEKSPRRNELSISQDQKLTRRNRSSSTKRSQSSIPSQQPMNQLSRSFGENSGVTVSTSNDKSGNVDIPNSGDSQPKIIKRDSFKEDVTSNQFLMRLFNPFDFTGGAASPDPSAMAQLSSTPPPILSTSAGGSTTVQQSSSSPHNPSYMHNVHPKNQKLALHLRRWMHLCPNRFLDFSSKNADSAQLMGHLNLNWLSLVEPACLPLTTEYWPDLQTTTKNEEYYTYGYTVIAEENYENKVEMLMRELICQRLHQGFQLYLSSSQLYDVSQKQTYKLSMSNQYHLISYDTFNPSSILIKRFIPKSEFNNLKLKAATQSLNSPYHYVLQTPTCNPLSDLSSLVQVSYFRAQKANDYNWNYLDYVVSGYHDEMTPNLRYRCIQFHLLRAPSKSNTSNTSNNKDSYENRVADFTEFKKYMIDRTNMKIQAGKTVDIEVLQKGALNKSSGNPRIAKFEKKKSSSSSSSSTELTSPTATSTSSTSSQFTTTDSNFDRYEWMYLVHKESYHPMEAFYFQVQWLVCSGSVIADFVQTLMRKAISLNFVLVPTPILFEQMSIEYHTPFQPVFKIPLHNESNVQKVKEQLRKEPFNFVPEYVPVSLSRRFVHESGMVLVQFNLDFSLYWVENSVMNNFTLLGLNPAQTNVNMLDLRMELEHFCESLSVSGSIVNEIIDDVISLKTPTEEKQTTTSSARRIIDEIVG